jgi:hypothetical protein
VLVDFTRSSSNLIEFERGGIAGREEDPGGVTRLISVGGELEEEHGVNASKSFVGSGQVFTPRDKSICVTGLKADRFVRFMNWTESCFL